MKDKIQKLVQYLEQFVNRPWYPALLAFVTFIDYFLIVVPTDGILISSCLLSPKKWISIALGVTVGAVFGSWALAEAVNAFGMDWLLMISPGLEQSATWIWMHEFFTSYGLLLVFAVALSPVIQHPAVILATLAKTSMPALLVVILAGRLTKYLLVSWICTHAPGLLSKFWVSKKEMNEVGLSLPSDKSK